MDVQIDQLLEQAEQYKKKWGKADGVPLILYGGIGLMAMLAIWVSVSAIGNKPKVAETTEEVTYVDERGVPVSPRMVERTIAEGHGELLDMTD